MIYEAWRISYQSSEQAARAAYAECVRLQAKIEVMERQKPVATVRINVINGNPSVDFVPGLHYLHHNDKLYLAPGAQPVPSIPEGWKLVPIEPTPEMMLVAQKADHDHLEHEEWLEYDGEDVKRVYRAMLAATPEAKP